MTEPPLESEELEWPARRAGILLHPTSLPGQFGIGDLGPAVEHFLDLLRGAGQSLWQVLPLGPPGAGNSPYAARSAFAGNPLLISPELLAGEGLLAETDLAEPPAGDPHRVDFAAVRAWKGGLLRRAFARAEARDRLATTTLLVEGPVWLPDFALFMALKGEDQRAWNEWEPAIARREPAAIAAARERLESEVRFHAFVQGCFARQWKRLQGLARERGVLLFGDIPIFLDLDSADVWANQGLFHLDESGRPSVVTGVPPDAFAANGQRWGNPHYRWDRLAEEGYGWWIERLRHAFSQVDVARIDHFRGFEAAWEIAAGEPTARHGRWVPGPGRDFFDRATAALGPLPIVVEDLGLITRKVRSLRDGLGYPGMKVLQFAFGDDARNPYLPHNFGPRSVVYTGTHDNDTTAGWFASRESWERDRIQRYLAVDGREVLNALIRTAYASVAETAIVPMQDVLGLGSEARMNVPGVADGNWGWRFSWDQVDGGRMAWLRDLALVYARTH